VFYGKKEGEKKGKMVTSEKTVFDVMALFRRKRFKGPIENKVPFKFK